MPTIRISALAIESESPNRLFDAGSLGLDFARKATLSDLVTGQRHVFRVP